MTELQGDPAILEPIVTRLIKTEKKLGVTTPVPVLQAKTLRELSAYTQEQELKKGEYLPKGFPGFLTPEGEFVTGSAKDMYKREVLLSGTTLTPLAERLNLEYENLEAEIAEEEEYEQSKNEERDGESVEDIDSLEGIREYREERADKDATGVLLRAGYAQVTLHNKGATVIAEPDVEKAATVRITYLRALRNRSQDLGR